ncbi:MAG: DUF2971 domain-containing protein [Terriglobales bacterium]
MSDATDAGLFKDLTARRPPRIVYHYTSASGLIGILKSRAIWATSIRFLNDSSEYSFAIDLVRKAIQDREATAHNTFDIALNSILAERLMTETQAEVYVSSFTENPDQLSQWRAYSPSTGGYAIGFRTKDLAQPEGSKPSRFLAHCVYDSGVQERLVKKLVQVVANSAETNRATGLERDRVFRETFKQFGRLLPLVAPVLKDPSFEEEQEWRLVCLPAAFEGASPHFRENRSMLVPYHEHHFPSKTPVPIEELVIGPTPHPQLARDAAKALLSANGMVSTTVQSSSIPYRTW